MAGAMDLFGQRRQRSGTVFKPAGEQATYTTVCAPPLCLPTMLLTVPVPGNPCWAWRWSVDPVCEGAAGHQVLASLWRRSHQRFQSPPPTFMALLHLVRHADVPCNAWYAPCPAFCSSSGVRVPAELVMVPGTRQFAATLHYDLADGRLQKPQSCGYYVLGDVQSCFVCPTAGKSGTELLPLPLMC